MPRGRKTKASTGSSAAQAQSTLSFNSKSARVTKPSARPDEAKKNPLAKSLSEPAQAQIEEEVTAIETLESGQEEARSVDVEAAKAEPSQIKVNILDSPAEEAQTQRLKPRAKRTRVQGGKDARELEAEKVTDSQIKKYWRAEEDSRLAPRVHQETLSLHEKILRHFDLSSQYGPCIGISRLQRWKRANLLGLEPPVEVLAVLLREEDKKTSQGCGKLAYIDELAGGRVILVE
ncbi:hypothetical protein A1O1_08943 [Capronia coronata CBS 617.96]|uniref:DNA polymerase delta subunit 4 n=1 Tax=Capronia coronata CBS 617.96 TaxID=1182541 RepID=W9XDJ5_9EURO|nr:uncharacterized protein A1O1_08943 [Capronia coronata CBS 617.96]EXJ78542.1 hypothetical protein A1O1_08943 [Capronia coronata CBS 617.96]